MDTNAHLHETGNLTAAEILDSMDEAFCMLDPEGRFLYLNCEAERLLGHNREGVIGRSVWEVLPQAVGGVCHQQYEKALKTGRPAQFEDRCIAGDRWYQVRMQPMAGTMAIHIRDVTDRKRFEEALAESEDRFRKTFEEGPLGMALLSGDSQFLRVNATFARMLGYAPEELKHKRWQDVTHPDDVAMSLGPVEELTQGRRITYRTEKRYITKSGEVRWGSLTVSVLRSHLDRPMEHLAMIEDITERKRIEEERAHLLKREQAARAEAEAANRRKDQFLAILSHELRTPLTPVLARISLLRRDPSLTPPVRSALELIRRNVELEASLIDDILDMTRITRGKLQLNMQPIDAHERILDALEIYRAEIETKRIQLGVDLAAQDHQVRADPARLQQIFWNLLSNAVKYTPPGGSITVRTRNDHLTVPVNRSEQSASPPRYSTLIVEIADSGVGIDAETMRHIFAPFEQGEQVLTRRYGGLGLGLTICKALVQMHGGRVLAQSAGRDRGAVFTVELPTMAAAAAQESEKLPHQPASILLVEDNQDTLSILARLLRSMGHRVVTANTVQSAFQLAGKERFDLIISDLGLPDGSGWELMRRLRDEKKMRGVALSGFGSDEDIQRSREAGFTAHLTKPIDVDRLEEIIQQVRG